MFKEAYLDRAVEDTVASKFRNGGQTCVCANRIYVHESIADEFTKKMKQAVEKLVVGNGLDEATDIGPLINEDAIKKSRSAYRRCARERCNNCYWRNKPYRFIY